MLCRKGSSDPAADLTFHLQQQEILRAINTRLDVLAATIDPRQRAAHFAVLADHFAQLRMWGRCIKLYRESLQTFDDPQVRLALAYVLLALHGGRAWGEVLELAEGFLPGAPLEEIGYQALDVVFNARFYGWHRHEQKADLNEKSSPLQGIVGESDHILDVCNKIVEYASAPAHMIVLITGPTGTGKEPAAEALHKCSSRREKPFVPVNCAAVPESVFESEIFGSVRGAFTGATNRKGLMEEANGGTLFLDEIGKLPLDVQAKLLRALDGGGEIRSVGANKPRRVDVRVVAATNMDLLELQEKGKFLEDLYWRVSALRIGTKPLMDHVEDLFVLAKHFVSRLVAGQGGEPFSDYDISYWLCSRYIPRILGHEDEPAVNIDQRTPAHVMFGLRRQVHVPTFVDLLPPFSKDPWPGNVRQFQHDVERAVVKGELKRLCDRPILAGVLRQGELIITSPTYTHEELDDCDIRIAKDICRTQAEAAKLLGVSKSWFSRKAKRPLGQPWRPS